MSIREIVTQMISEGLSCEEIRSSFNNKDLIEVRWQIIEARNRIISDSEWSIIARYQASGVSAILEAIQGAGGMDNLSNAQVLQYSKQIEALRSEVNRSSESGALSTMLVLSKGASEYEH